jgi:hypothetical protein
MIKIQSAYWVQGHTVMNVQLWMTIVTKIFSTFFQELSKYYNFLSKLRDLLKEGVCKGKDMLDRIEKFRNSITGAEILGKLKNLKPETKAVEKFMEALEQWSANRGKLPQVG